MKKIYLWLDMQGNKQIIVAKSLSEARQILILQQEPFFKLKPKGYLTARSFNRQELIIITKQLATMLRAGLPIIETLTLLANDHPITQWKWLLNEIKKQILNGDAISQTLAQYPDVFPPIYQEIIATGELTGQLENSFDRIAIQLEKTQQLHKRFKKALRYPLFLLIVSMIVTLIMLLVVLPKFTEIYQSFDAQLPAFTQLIISLSEYLQHYALHLLCVFSAGIIFYHRYLCKYHRRLLEKQCLALPIFGNIIVSANLSQIFQTLSITQQAGIPLLAGINMAKKTAYYQIFHDALQHITIQIEQGNTFSSAIHLQPIFPNLCIQLIRIGEESGTLDIMLERLAAHYQQNNEELTDQLSQKIEPLMMSIMAILIGSLVIALYLPVFQLGNAIH